MADPKKTHEEPHSSGQFDREIHMRSILYFVVGIAVLTIGAFVLAWSLGSGLESYLASGDPEPLPVAQGPAGDTTPPLPHLQTHPYEDMVELRAEEEAHLASYGMVDEARNKIRIPIDAAIERAAREGLPRWEPVSPDTANGNNPAEGR